MDLIGIEKKFKDGLIVRSAVSDKSGEILNMLTSYWTDRGFFTKCRDGEGKNTVICLYDKDSKKEATILYDDEDISFFSAVTQSICSLLEHKNKNYGNSALEPLNIFSGKSKVGTRLDDKLARIKNSEELRKNDVSDLIGYLILECKDRGWNNFDEFKD